MANDFIVPNWHPLFIHFPIALLVLGFLIEIITFARPRGGFRAAGRWMLLLGAFLALPATTSGIYAFRDVAAPAQLDVDQHWHQVLATNSWSPGHWDAISDHIWYNSGAVVLFLAAVGVWLGSSDKWRCTLRLPLLAVVLVGLVLMSIGAWHGGELVYKFGTGVEPGAPAGGSTAGHGLTWYIPPLQLHLVLAGFAVALVVAAVALMVRRWQLDRRVPAPAAPLTEGQPVAPGIMALDVPAGAGQPIGPASDLPQNRDQQPVAPPSEVYPGWFWLGAFGLAIVTAVAGAWAALGVFSKAAFREGLEELRQADHRRLALHVALGVLIIVLSLFLAALVRFARRWRRPAGILAGLVLLLIAWQIWVGVLITFDSPEGSLFRFAAVTQAGEPATMPPPAAPARTPVPQPSPSTEPVRGSPAASQQPAAAPPPTAPGAAPHEEIGT